MRRPKEGATDKVCFTLNAEEPLAHTFTIELGTISFVLVFRNWPGITLGPCLFSFNRPPLLAAQIQVLVEAFQPQFELK